MAKRDFIVKGDLPQKSSQSNGKDSLIEKENRTTIAGIIAIVAVVLIVATFMRVQHLGFFSQEDTNKGGLAAETFLGIRHVSLISHDALVGHLAIQGLSQRTYYVYPNDNLLVVDFGERYTQAVLAPEQGGLYGTYADIQSDVDAFVNLPTRQLLLHNLVANLPAITLTELRVSEGSISVAGNEYQFRLVATELSVFSDGNQETIHLNPTSDGLSGVWQGHDVLATADVLTISDFY